MGEQREGREIWEDGEESTGGTPESADRGEGGLGMCEVEMKGLREDADEIVNSKRNVRPRYDQRRDLCALFLDRGR